MKTPTLISSLLVLSAVNLTLMVPGGFIESRDFSHISPMILGAFNILLTALGMISFFLAYFVFRKQRWAFMASLLCSIGYFIVYVIDLAEIFPKSPSPMPTSLLSLEIFGTILSIPLSLYAFKAFDKEKTEGPSSPVGNTIYWIIAAAMIIGLGIIIFATKSAMTANT
ncbi:hypothetical protein [Jiulongibacter sediminis]|uniref:DUF8051 domain-containing protein n=1 Tax=Jiulongibacter sediminis TaxID=1605367 RepID=A0A0P7BBU8_9BACT|nr:hypothetical protein [Jiulongibacter sediminis]KPM47982.1 hypothetical protein AFM12_12245 [Jiulongibacter sediminis]TBX24164.1 hypothetical protein TK44_12255 [Jiulongibacter sediminis]